MAPLGGLFKREGGQGGTVGSPLYTFDFFAVVGVAHARAVFCILFLCFKGSGSLAGRGFAGSYSNIFRTYSNIFRTSPTFFVHYPQYSYTVLNVGLCAILRR